LMNHSLSPPSLKNGLHEQVIFLFFFRKAAKY